MSSNVSEEWRPVVGYEGFYEVSSFGQVRSLGRWTNRGRLFRPGQLLKPQKGIAYLQVNLCGATQRATKPIHALVAASFLGPRPEGIQINHIDANKHNNAVTNLEYVTPANNTAHATYLGLRKTYKGVQHSGAKLNEKDVLEIRKLQHVVAPVELSKRYKVSIGTIYDVWRRRSWAHI